MSLSETVPCWRDLAAEEPEDWADWADEDDEDEPDATTSIVTGEDVIPFPFTVAAAAGRVNLPAFNGLRIYEYVVCDDSVLFPLMICTLDERPC